MAKIDRVKEFVGYLKVVFGILVAIDVSIIAWLFQNNQTIPSNKIILASFFAVVIVFAIIIVNKKILSKIDEMEEL